MWLFYDSVAGAWLVTGGTATGVMEFVGEAVQEKISSSSVGENECVALGIASWGYVSNNAALDGEGVCDFECVSYHFCDRYQVLLCVCLLILSFTICCANNTKWQILG